MADFPKQEVIADQYVVQTTEADGGFTTRVFGYRNKMIMWAKVYKTVHYTTAKEAEEGHKAIKKEFL